MKIAIEATLLSQEQVTGLGVYVRELLQAFADGAAGPGDEFFLLHAGKRWSGPSFGKNFIPVSYHLGFSQFAGILFRLPHVLKEIGADVFHATCNTGIPPHCPIPAVATIHDLYPLFGQGISPRFRLTSRLLYAWTLREAKAFLCNSVATRDDLIRIRCSAENTHVTYLAPALPEMRPETVLPVPPPYCLCTGAQEPRKGQRMLAEAYLLAKERMPSIPPLVFVGPDRGDGKYLRAIADRHPEIILLNYLPGPELAACLRHASVFLFPSFFEGFGLPVVEALSVGIPVICSDIAALREIAHDSTVFVLPEANAFADAIVHFFEHPAPVCHAEKAFSWRKCAQQTRLVYEEILRCGNSIQR